MTGGMYILREDGELEAMTEQQYDSEDLLQALLENHPSIMAGDQISPSSPRRWLLVKREADVPGVEGGGGRWSLDHLFLDQDGIPTLVEVKRSTDTRIRREVVGQMLDYAANAMEFWSIESVQANFEQTCAKKDESVDAVLNEFLGPEGDPDAFWQAVKTNLQAGKIRLLFVADQIPDELRRVIEFLNTQMDPAEVLAVEIRQFEGGSLKTLVPRVIGQTAEAERRKGSTSRNSLQWDEESFFRRMEALGRSEEATIARRILDWTRSNEVHVWWGRGTTMASFSPRIYHKGTKHQLFSVFSGAESGQSGVELYFQWYAGKPPYDDVSKRRSLLKLFNEIPGVSLSDDVLSMRPSIPLGHLSSVGVLKQFFEVMDHMLAEIRST